MNSNDFKNVLNFIVINIIRAILYYKCKISKVKTQNYSFYQINQRILVDSFY